MVNKTATLEITENDYRDSLDFDELENKLQSDLDSQLSELDFLNEEKEKIGNPESLGKTIMNVVWEQFLNQIAVVAGTDFIEQNRGLTLDLRDEAHIQTTENFAKGKIAAHNDKIDFQQRYDDWQGNFQRDENGSIKTKHDNRSNTDQYVLNKDARKPFDENRDKGSATVHKDHTVPAAEIIRDPKANAHLDKKEQIDFANSDKNLKDLDAAANQSKGDSGMNDWLDSQRDGKKPAERFNIDEEELRERDKDAREDYEKLKDEGEQRTIKAGRQSQKEEAFRITGKALRAVAMQLLAELIREVIGKLISWLKSDQKSVGSLLEHIKSAVLSFIGKLKVHLLNAGSTILTTIATAILGPIVGAIKKVWIMLKQGWKSLKEAVEYLKRPDNRNKPIGRLILETGKIVVAGLSATGAILLGGAIEKGLMIVPPFAFEIPMLGSLASLIGMFMGALVVGIIGAIAINLIDKAVAKQQMSAVIERKAAKGNEILSKQNTLIYLNEEKLEYTKEGVYASVKARHKAAEEIANEALDNIFHEGIENEAVCSRNGKRIEAMVKNLKELQL